MAKQFRMGAIFPQIEFAHDAAQIRRFAVEMEAMGYDHIIAYDHVLGADTTNRPDWQGPYNLDSSFFEPISLFSYWASITTRIGFTNGVVILPQRQTALFAKQAATVDFLSGGRLCVGVGTGWNKVEYDALGVPFEDRARILDEQIPLLRRFWTERSFSDKGPNHDIVEAGIWPLPVQRPIPIWVGGLAKPAMRRAARIGDGWLPYLQDIAEVGNIIAEFRDMVSAAGRDPDKVTVDNIVWLNPLLGPQLDVDGIVALIEESRRVGAAGAAVDITRIGLKTPDEHIGMFRQIAERLGLGR